jgi:hypothetical protein
MNLINESRRALQFAETRSGPVWMDRPIHLLVDGGSEGVGRVDDASGVLVGVVHVGDGVLRHTLQVAATPRRVPTAGVWWTTKREEGKGGEVWV